MEWKAKCLEVSGKISNFALNESKTVRQPFLRLTRTFIFVRGATHVVIDGSNDRAPAFGLTRTTIFLRGSPILIISEYVGIARCTCQLETCTGLQPTRPIDCVRGASHVVTQNLNLLE